MSTEFHDALARALAPIVARVRTDVTAIKTANGSRWTKQALNDNTLRQHVNGGPARGVCPIPAGSSITMLALLDLDSHKGEVSWDQMLMHTVDVCQVLAKEGLAPIVWRSSGGRGVHIMLLWENPQDAYSVRMHLRSLIGRLGFEDGAKGVAKKTIEVFPRQDEVEPGGYGNQFILPLAGESLPIFIDYDLGLATLGAREDVLTMDWPLSEPVPRLERPAPAARPAPESADLARLRSALMSIPNTAEDHPDYFGWRDLAFAVHAATNGSDEGRDLFVEFSEQYPDFDRKFFDERVWPYIRSGEKRGRAITAATVFKMASDRGWIERPSADGFDDLDAPTASGTLVEPQMSAARAVEVYGLARRYEAGSQGGSEGFDDGLDDLGLPREDSDAPAGGQGAARGGSAGSVGGPGGGYGGAFAVIEDGLPDFTREKNGKIEPTVGNLLKALRRPDLVGVEVAIDNFRDELMIAPHGTADWRAFGDADYVWLRDWMEMGFNGFKPIPKELVKDTVWAVADANRFDSARLWLEGLTHDGVPRCETLLHRYFGCDDTPYSRAASLYLCTAMAGRVMEPGCKADMVVILVGGQGTGKSTGIAALAPSPEFFTEISFSEDDDDLARKMRGKLIAEIGELRGLHTKELEAIKAFITRTHEHWIPKFKEFSTQFPRRLVFVGSTNKDQFLADDTGNRRWAPIRAGVVDVQGVRAACLQVWAEAREIWKRTGVQWQALQSLAEAEHSQYEMGDEWEGTVARWIASAEDFDGNAVRDRAWLTTNDVLKEALGFDQKTVRKGDSMRAAAVLRKLGYERRKVRMGEKTEWAFVPTVPTS